MKKYILLYCFSLFALGVNAQSKYLDIGLNFRTDYNASFNDDQPNERKINLNTLKLIFTGSVYPGITYKVQQRLNDAAFLESDKYTSSTEDAWLNFAPQGWKWDFTVGKQDILFGTFESNYDPSDMYLISMVFDNFNRSQVGIAARYTWPRGNTVSMQISNVRGEQLSHDSNHSFAYTVNGAQKFLDNLLNTSIGYSLIHSGDGHYYHWLTLGSYMQLKNFFMEVDAYAGRYRQNMTMDANQNNYRAADNFSVSLTNRYQIKKFILFAKIAQDYQLDVLNDTMSKRSLGFALGAEYYPIKGQDLRIHSAYMFRHNRFGDMWLDKTGTETNNLFTLGVKWNVNLGKLLSMGK